MCVCVSGPAVPPDFPGTARPSRASWASRAAPRGLCGSHTEAVWQPQRLCGSHTGAVAVPQQHIVAVEKPQQLCWLYREAICCLYKLYMPVKHGRIRPENIDSGTNGVGKPPFGLKLCVVRAVHLRMPPACLDCQKTKNPSKNTGFGDFGAPGPIGPYFRPISRCGMRCGDCAKRILRLF